MRSHFALLVVLLSFFTVGTTVVAGDIHSHSTNSSHVMQDRTSMNGKGMNATARNGTTLRIKPRQNGDAKWNVSMQFALRNKNETAAFKRMGKDFKNGQVSGGDIGFSANTFRIIAKREQEATGRQMKIRNPKRNYFINNDTGTLVLSFVWTNFTRVHDDKIYLHDAFMLDDDSTWLGSLSSKQNLVIDDPDAYRVQSVSNSGYDNGTVVVQGGVGSSSHLPLRIIYVKKSAPTSRNKYQLNSFPYQYAAAFLVLVGIVGASVYAFLQQNGDDDEPLDGSDLAD